jgi:glycosyltransferase involved in cell wall biosynthesis
MHPLSPGNPAPDPAGHARLHELVASGFRIHRLREPTADELAHWAGFLTAGGSFADLLRSLREGDDGRSGPVAAVTTPDPALRPPSATPRQGRVAILSTYPPDPPEHGGQHRLRNIGFAYTAAGFDVRHLGVLGSSGQAAAPGFLPFPGEAALKRVLPSTLFMEDWIIGHLFGSPGPQLDAFVAAAGPVPDVIHVEQPWLFRLARRWAARRGGPPPLLVYGSQNVEHSLKRTIVSSYFGAAAGTSAAERVLDLELAALQEADVVLAVTTEDADWLRSRGARDVVVAPNGVGERPRTAAGLVAANAITGNAKFALVCGSAHPPNITSMAEIFGAGFACFSPRERLVLAGGLGAAMRADPRFASNASLHVHLRDGGYVTEECIQGLLDTAHAVLLPITAGEGSNLKTAEALWAGKHVVATRTAMRGFESFLGASGLTVVDDAQSFLHAVRRAMEAPPLRISEDERRSRRALLWEHKLQPMTAFVSSRLNTQARHAEQS